MQNPCRTLVWCARSKYPVTETRDEVLALIQSVTASDYVPDSDSAPAGFIFVTYVYEANTEWVVGAQVALNVDHISSVVPTMG